MATCARCDVIIKEIGQPHVCLALPQSTTAPEPLAECGRCGAFGPAGTKCTACSEAPSTLNRPPAAAVVARVTGRVRSIDDGRARLHLDEQPPAWDGAAEGQEIEVVVMARGRR